MQNRHREVRSLAGWQAEEPVGRLVPVQGPCLWGIKKWVTSNPQTGNHFQTHRVKRDIIFKAVRESKVGKGKQVTKEKMRSEAHFICILSGKRRKRMQWRLRIFRDRGKYQECEWQQVKGKEGFKNFNNIKSYRERQTEAGLVPLGERAVTNHPAPWALEKRSLTLVHDTHPSRGDWGFLSTFSFSRTQARGTTIRSFALWTWERTGQWLTKAYLLKRFCK